VSAPPPVQLQLLCIGLNADNINIISSSATTCRYADAIRSVGRSLSPYLAATIVSASVRVCAVRYTHTRTNRPTHAQAVSVRRRAFNVCRVVVQKASCSERVVVAVVRAVSEEYKTTTTTTTSDNNNIHIQYLHNNIDV